MENMETYETILLADGQVQLLLRAIQYPLKY